MEIFDSQFFPRERQPHQGPAPRSKASKASDAVPSQGSSAQGFSLGFHRRVNKYVCMYIYIYLSLYIYIYIYCCIRLTFFRMYIYIYICIYIYRYIYIYISFFLCDVCVYYDVLSVSTCTKLSLLTLRYVAASFGRHRPDLPFCSIGWALHCDGLQHVLCGEFQRSPNSAP